MSNTRKKVLWLNHFVPYPPKGGVLLRTHGLLCGLAKEHDVSLCCLIQPRILAPYFSSLAAGIEISKRKLLAHVKALHYAPLPSEGHRFMRLFLALFALFSPRPYSVHWLQSRHFKRQIKHLLKQQSFDVIHLDTMALAQYLPKDLNCPVVINHHNAEHEMMWRRAKKARNPLKAWYFKLEGNKIARFDAAHMHVATQHICCSEQDAASIRKLGAKRVDVVPNGVAYQVPLRRRVCTGRLLFVGGLDWYPNRDAMEYWLKELWPALIARFPQLHLDIIGKDPSEAILRLAQQSKGVSVHGYVDDLAAYYNEAMACICPLRDGGGTKLKVLEAMSHGLVVLGSDIAFEGLAVEHGDNVIFANDLDDYIAAFKHLLGSPMDVQMIGNRANVTVAKYYDVKKISQNYSALIQRLAGTL